MASSKNVSPLSLRHTSPNFEAWVNPIANLYLVVRPFVVEVAGVFTAAIGTFAANIECVYI
jgi:hypothetical protein